MKIVFKGCGLREEGGGAHLLTTLLLLRGKPFLFPL